MVTKDMSPKRVASRIKDGHELPGYLRYVIIDGLGDGRIKVVEAEAAAGVPWYILYDSETGESVTHNWLDTVQKMVDKRGLRNVWKVRDTGGMMNIVTEYGRLVMNKWYSDIRVMASGKVAIVEIPGEKTTPDIVTVPGCEPVFSKDAGDTHYMMHTLGDRYVVVSDEHPDGTITSYIGDITTGEKVNTPACPLIATDAEGKVMLEATGPYIETDFPGVVGEPKGCVAYGDGKVIYTDVATRTVIKDVYVSLPDADGVLVVKDGGGAIGDTTIKGKGKRRTGGV